MTDPIARVMRPRALEQSESLHARVRAFASSVVEGATPSESFEELALAIAAFQRQECPGLERLIPAPPSSLEELPLVPAEVFRLTRVATYPAELDVARFQTSGTTKRETGVHPTRTLSTYDHLALLLARSTLFRGLSARPIIVALAEPKPGPRPTSSLTYMMELFMREIDGRSLSTDPVPAELDYAGRFLIGPRGVDIEGLRRAVRLARHRQEPLVVLGTSFAYVALLEALGDERLPPAPLVRLMITGGFKGRAREVPEQEIRAQIARAFSAEPEQVLGEYGMTELTSQLYEAWGSEGKDEPKSAWFPARGRASLYHAPPWLRVLAVDPVTHARVRRGTEGLAAFIDLGNIDSCLTVLTEDRILEIDGGIQLLGRAPAAPPRGCSLTYESLLGGGKL
ncbi:MAG: hypothetical protein B6A08_10745 [Sorangiineae bacterium NIC37A_2]|nr:MAG: hypothetical protein B6A08_10745 [Sorangiineae bacterium NIC37A_2]